MIKCDGQAIQVLYALQTSHVYTVLVIIGFVLCAVIACANKLQVV